MAAITRHALRVYAALAELRGNQGDVLDALVPFFEPILQVMHGRIFDPQLLATGAKKLYRWRINKDIAEQFIPRLVRKGYLKRSGDGQTAFYIVNYNPPQDSANIAGINQVLRRIVDEFEAFLPTVSDLQNYHRTRDDLTDILIRFLVSLDAYGETAFVAEVSRLDSEEQEVLGLIPEGGTPLAGDDRYMCARFVKQICDVRPDFVPHLARLASIGLLTEVVEDFVKPTDQATQTTLTLVLDTPVALDYLGCSGKDFKDDVKTVLDTLREIGCSVVVFPVTCTEIQNNLNSMLNLPRPQRHGYTHEAMRKGEVMEAYVQTVAQNPERALEEVGIQVRAISLHQYPGQHHFFDEKMYEDFLSAITWGNDIEAREHDATCLALLLRLRQGRHNTDLFRCGYVFVTRNTTFANRSRAYCLQARVINHTQQGPVIHQREIATIAWLRTGLGAALDIPRSALIATCDRVLRLRLEVQAAVAATLSDATPEKMEQFNLLIQDYRSIRKLADETLNDERVVTAANADLLLEAMRQATIADEKEKLQKEYSQLHGVGNQEGAHRESSGSRHKMGTTGVHLTCTLCTSRQTKKFFLLLTIRPRFVGRAARLRAATLPIIAFHNYASGKAGGRCAPRLVTAVLGLAARSRPAAPGGRAKRSLRQSGGGEHRKQATKKYPGHKTSRGTRALTIGFYRTRGAWGAVVVRRALMTYTWCTKPGGSRHALPASRQRSAHHILSPCIQIFIIERRPYTEISTHHSVATASGRSPTTLHHKSLGEPR